MTPSDLSQIGQQLYGSRWKAPLARALGVRRETVSALANGKRPISSQIAAAVRLLASSSVQAKPYRERRFAATGKATTITSSLGSVARLIHGDSRDIIKTLDMERIDAICTDPVWPNALPEIAGSHNPFALLSEVLFAASAALDLKQVIVQMRCDSDPRMLSAIPPGFPFIRTSWLPYAVPSRQGRLLISGDVAFIFGKPPKPRANGRILPGQPHSDFCPPAQPAKSKPKHPCPRSVQHVEWLIEKFTDPGATILDPLMGSGTTAISALRRGRNVIGVDINRNFVNLAIQRIKAEFHTSDIST